MKVQSNTDRRRYWEDQVRRSKAHRGSLASYCRQAGIPVSALSYWRKKLAREPGRIDQGKSPFIAVQLGEAAAVPVHTGAPRLPDPKWVAQLILQLGQGGLQ